jgi:predicted alpha/beta superfamily hydrolase
MPALRNWLLAIALAWAVLGAARVHATSANAVEYFNATLGHYFITADADEASALDAGTPSGWTRTGFAFSVHADAAIGRQPVCRFFSASFAPRSSHFYTPFAAECAALKLGTTWSFESTAFYLDLPSSAGTCGSGVTAIYRMYNNGADGAPNHRYTSERAIVDSMAVHGWVIEGHGATGIFACGPPPPRNESAVAYVSATKIGSPYKVSIVVPAGHGAQSDPIPVIYALDAQIRYTSLLAVMRETNARAILVAIEDMGRRQTDYNMPGARDFLDYLTRDLIPYIDSNYRADPRKRVLSGLSTGGNFMLHALYLETPGRYTFAHYWSSEGAFWQQFDTVNAEEQAIHDQLAGAPLPVTLIFARGGLGSATNSAVVRALYERMTSRHYAGLRLLDYYYPELGHVPMDAPSFRDELALLLSKSPGP